MLPDGQTQFQLVHSMKGATGLESGKAESENIDNTCFTKAANGRRTIYVKGLAEHPVAMLAQAWESLSSEVQAALAILIEQILSV